MRDRETTSRRWFWTAPALALCFAFAAQLMTAYASASFVSISIQSPSQGATVFGSITVSGSAYSRFGISSVSLAVDSGPFQPASLANGSWTFPLNTNNLSNGSHSLTAKAFDTHGHSGSTSITVNVNNLPPTISISSPLAGATVTGTVAVSGTAASQAGIASVQVEVDSNGWVLASGTTSWSQSIDTSAYANGTHTFSAMATDSVGHASTTAISVTFSNPLPTISISSPEAGQTITGTVAVSGTAASQAGLTSVQVEVDSNGWVLATGTTSWSLSIDTTAYSNATHTISATATDSLGHSTTTSISVTVSNLIQTYQGPWFLPDSTGNVSVVSETMFWDGDTNYNSKLPTGYVIFQVNSTIQPNDADAADTCSQDPSTGYWSCFHSIQSADLQWVSSMGWSLHYSFYLQVEYPLSDTFTITYGGDINFASSSAQAIET